ncbi:MAG: zinc ABC transporter substrate-binding protein [Hyphomicrobiales bacterium]
MRRLKLLSLSVALLFASHAVPYLAPLSVAKADVNVVASIKPVHSLVAAVMEGVGKPGLIVEGAASPHNYALKPSQAKMLEDANIVFWIGHDLEPFLEKSLETIAAKAKSVELIDAHDLIKHEFREGGAFDEHGHEEKDDHKETAGHDDHDKHDKHDDHDDHDKKAKSDHKEHKKAGHDHEAHGAHDAHVWLDPVNAKALVHEIEETLVEADPANAGKYEANAKAISSKIDVLIADVAAELKPLHDKNFIVFHDAYQYFEKRFDVTASGSITVSPEVLPGAERISEIRSKLKGLDAACVFAEPQFESKLVSTVIEGTKAKSGIIDPLGARLDAGPNLYFQLIQNMAASFKGCLT